MQCLYFPLLDINECELNIGNCPTGKECKNIPGGYDCVDSKKNSMYVFINAYQVCLLTDNFFEILKKWYCLSLF